MKALVTGGAGFIGSNIVARLRHEGHEVAVLDNLLSGYRINLEPLDGVRCIEGDVRDPRAVDEAMAGSEVVFHLAASVGNKRSIEQPLTDAEINVLGTLQILEGARRHGLRKVVASSSAGIFGELRELPISEDHPVEPDSPYGCTKLCEEKLCLAYSKLYELEAVCLRYFNVYGPNQRFDAYGNVIPIFVFQMLRGRTLTFFGDGEQTRDFVNVHGVVQANLNAAKTAGVSSAFNSGYDTRITINELVRLTRETAGFAPDVRYGPPGPGDVRDSLADISAARQAFGFSPSVGLREGLTEYLAWAREEVARG